MISVIIPVYNDWERLKKALDSVAKQTYEDVEVIVVDDGSDEKSQIADFKLQNGEQAKIVRQENKGAPAARNRGFTEAKGEYVIFWDADVVAEPIMLEKLKHALDKHPEASFAYCNFRLQISDCRINILKFAFCNLKSVRSQAFNFEDLKRGNYIHTTSLIRRSDVIRWDESVKRFQDWDLWLTIAELGKIGVWVDDYLFLVLAGGKISSWLPSFAYKAPIRWLPFVRRVVKKYENAKQVIVGKHALSKNNH